MARPRASSESQTFLDDLEKAKALSLETLELDRLRREQKALKALQQKALSRSQSPITGSEETHQEQGETGLSSKVSVKSRPRPGPKSSVSLDQSLPPPPRRQTAASTSSVQTEFKDLMDFSPTEKEKPSRDLDALVGINLNGTNSKSNLSETVSVTTATSVVANKIAFPPGPQPLQNVFTGTPSIVALPCTPIPLGNGNSIMNPVNSPITFLTQLTPTPSVQFGTSPPVRFPDPWCFPKPNLQIPSLELPRKNSAPSIIIPHSQNDVGPFVSHPLPSTPVQTPLVNASIPDLLLSHPALSVLKAIEKKRNSNLIDLADSEDLLGLGIKDCSGRKEGSVATKEDLLKTFDPLMADSDKDHNSLNSAKEEDTKVPVEEPVYNQIWVDRNKQDKKLQNRFEDNFEPEVLGKGSLQKEKDSDDDVDTPPPLPPRPALAEMVVDGKVVSLREKSSPPRPSSCRKRHTRSAYESLKVINTKLCPNSELEGFYKMVKKLRSEFLYDDHLTNAGLVISPILESLRDETTSIKLVISSLYLDKPIPFTCDVTTTIEHVISHVVCSIFDDITNINFDNYVLKVHGLAEYFSADSSLVDYEYVHYCQKFDEDVHLTLLDVNDLQRKLARTAQDDINDTEIQLDSLMPPAAGQTITQQSLSILLETFEREVDKMREQALKVNAEALKPKGVIQAVKAICAILSQVETTEITEAVEGLIQISLQFGSGKVEGELNSGFKISEEVLADSQFTVVELLNQYPNTPNTRMEWLHYALEHLNQAIRDLLDMYCRAFQVNFHIPLCKSPPSCVQDITNFKDSLLVYIGAVHRIPPNWTSSYEKFIIHCELYHGIEIIGEVIKTKLVGTSASFYEQVLFDEWLQFTNVIMCLLPREARLIFNLYGTHTIPAESKSPEAGRTVQTPLAWAVLQLFQFDGVLNQGSILCGMWSEECDKTYGPAISNLSDPHCAIIQVSLPEFDCTYVFPPITEGPSSLRRDFESLDRSSQQRLLDIIDRPAVTLCSKEEQELLWDKRHYLYDVPQALPRVLLAAHSWHWACLTDIYQMLHEWKAMNPIDALELLLPCFPDVEVRKMAISWVKNLGSDELCDYLPQLVQALKYETWDDSPTAHFILERSLTSIRVAHHLYWLLKQNLDDPRCSRRISLILNAMLAVAGKALRIQFESQEQLVSSLSEIANKIKTTKESLRLNTLLHELGSIHHMLEDQMTSLPLSPSLEVKGVEVKACSYFTSNTLPLRISFKSSEAGALPIDAIFKVGDDLRQDSLTLQMIRIMDKLWLREGVDLRIVTFGCIATGDKTGMVEMVTNSETLRKIQTEHGLTGSFKDRPIAEWLQKHNPSELEYQQAVENFTFSCAGYSVATYVLGICDRHNDNIMLKTSGHMFHIDFGKFLGDAQMFGNIKRDRVPFVLTSDMIYVINGGDKPSSKFQQFVDLCCQAFNIVRKHSNLFFNLFTLMSSARIPGVTLEAVSYIQRALLPDKSDAEASSIFTKMIEDSLKSWSTQINFFFHNLAQLRFTGDHNDGTLLSFIPKTYTMETDGCIKSVEVFGYQKRYEPEKYYVYILKIERENQPDPVFLFRSYREFWEFHQKLCSMFPLAKYRSLPRGVYLGRSNIRQVAEKRKAEIEQFLKSLWKMADEIKQCDLVYTFFHPLLRDQQDNNRHLQKVKDAKDKRRQYDGTIRGQVKLSVCYHGDTLFIMVMHARNLNSAKTQGPDPYVKSYLLPDQNKTTKRKTKVVRRNCHPTFMEMLQYKLPLEVVKQRTLQVSVWDYDRMVENTFLGAVNIHLKEIDLKKETVRWYSLGNILR